MKTCTKCREHKRQEDFYGRKAECKSCQRKYASRKYVENEKKSPRHWKDTNLKRNYGISLEEFEKIADDQKHLCAICSLKKDLCLDHRHSDGLVRGLLCRKCNAGLGQFLDSSTILKKAIAYLESCD